MRNKHSTLKGMSKGNTTHNEYPEVGRVAPWTDFNLKIIKNLLERPLSKHLRRRYHDLRDPPKLQPSDLEIHEESCLRSLLERSNREVVTEALSRSKEFLKFNVSMAIGAQSKLLYGNRFKPDLEARSDMKTRTISFLETLG